jgi:hypothetical protein
MFPSQFLRSKGSSHTTKQASGGIKARPQHPLLQLAAVVTPCMHVAACGCVDGRATKTQPGCCKQPMSRLSELEQAPPFTRRTGQCQVAIQAFNWVTKLRLGCTSGTPSVCALNAPEPWIMRRLLSAPHRELPLSSTTKAIDDNLNGRYSYRPRQVNVAIRKRLLAHAPVAGAGS